MTKQKKITKFAYINLHSLAKEVHITFYALYTTCVYYINLFWKPKKIYISKGG